jgi:predicted acetyltransferase
MDLRLVPYQLGDETEAVASHYVMAADGHSGFLLDWDEESTWASWVEKQREAALGHNLAHTRVPATQLAARVGGALVGRVSIRFSLNEYLEREGGHIGYYLLPTFRGKGLGVEMCRQSLIIARSRGVDRVLIVCRDDNAPSAAVAQRCGAVLENTITVEGKGRLRRYWID